TSSLMITQEIPRARKPSLQGAIWSGGSPLFLLPRPPSGQGPRVARVPAGLLAGVRASGCERLECLAHSCLDDDTARSILESEQSPVGDVRSLPVMPLGD